MNSNFKKLFIVLSIFVIIVSVASCTKKTDDMNKTDENITVNTSVEKWEKDLDNTPIIETKASWEYKSYNQWEIANIKWNIVLFFHAGWCPSCKTTDKKLNLEQIPENLTILKVDYDSENDLKKKYEVTTQHTFVQIDNSWNLVNKWIGSRDVSDILENIK